MLLPAPTQPNLIPYLLLERLRAVIGEGDGMNFFPRGAGKTQDLYGVGVPKKS